MYRIAVLLGLWLAVSLGALAQTPEAQDAAEEKPHKARLVLVGSGFFSKGKLELFQQVAEQAGVRLDYVVAPLPAETRDQAIAGMRGADLVLVDVPPVPSFRDDAIAGHLRRVPRVVIFDRESEQSPDLPKAQAALLAAYARNGGRQNLAALMEYLVRWKAEGAPPADAPQALVIPKTGIYHPDYPGMAFADLQSYLEWLGPRVKAGQPVLGISMFASAIGSNSTGHVDAMVRGIERRGGIAVPFFRDTEGGVPLSLLMRDGRAFVDVVANLEIMYRTNVAEDYAKLGVPVLQAITYWEGDEAVWQDDPQGISAGSTSLYLALPEQAGYIDPLVVAAAPSRMPPNPIPAQMESLLNKAIKLAELRRKANADKRVAIVFYNYPSGEKNMGAAGLNLPESLAATLDALQKAGYRTQAESAEALLPRLQQLLSVYYREGRLEALEAEGLLALLPVSEYQAWFQTLPESVRERIVQRWGQPGESGFVLQRDGQAHFAIPRLQLGHIVLLPQPGRTSKPGESTDSAAYHDTALPVDHFYLAAYLYLRTQVGSDAIVHFGTHGTQEWTYGKERGLSVYDNPMLLVGDVPVVYPYIVDDVGEALQAKRRGRAVTVSYQTPAFGIAGLQGDALRMHQLIEEYEQLDQGVVREQVRQELKRMATETTVGSDLGWEVERIEADFDGYLGALHAYLDDMAVQAQPQGLHVFGVSSNDERRIGTLRLMLAERINTVLGIPPGHPPDPDYRELVNEPGHVWLRQHLREDVALPADAPAAQVELLQAARAADESLDARHEFGGLLTALDGNYLSTSLGGDPLRVPESLPTGRNLYGFDPMRVPSQAAWQAGQVALQQLVDAYREEHDGQYPEKLAFSLWGVETMRHNGILEAQVFAALGVRPVWGEGGRIESVELIPASELGRPRIDVVLSATGLYRDQFPLLMTRINEAIALALEAEEGDNVIARNTRAVRERLVANGLKAEDADLYARTRMFSSAQGTYGSGLGSKVTDTGSWEADTELAESHLGTMQYGYGPDPKRWGQMAEGVNAYAEQLRGTQAAVLSRSSNLLGMLTTDDPYSYLGGLSLAVRHLDGEAPELFISNLRNPTQSRVESASRFLATELQTRQFHAGWVEQLQQEGYAGTLAVVSSLDNFWGWQAVDPGVVRAQQWQEFHDIYVKDKLGLGVREWFDRDNPHALAQIVERMLEAHRKDYWQPDEDTLRSLVETWNELEAKHDLLPGSDKLRPHVAQLATGFGLETPARNSESAEAAGTAPMQNVTGLQLEQSAANASESQPWWTLLPIMLAFAAGALVQSRRNRFQPSRH